MYRARRIDLRRRRFTGASHRCADMSRRLLMVRCGPKCLVPVCRTIAAEDLPMFTGSVWQRALSLLREFLRTRLVKGEIADHGGDECVFQGNNFQVKLSVRPAEASALSVLARTTGRASATGPYQKLHVLPQTVVMHIEPWIPAAPQQQQQPGDGQPAAAPAATGAAASAT